MSTKMPKYFMRKIETRIHFEQQCQDSTDFFCNFSAECQRDRLAVETFLVQRKKEYEMKPVASVYWSLNGKNHVTPYDFNVRRQRPGNTDYETVWS